jgi:hypothetical protein
MSSWMMSPSARRAMRWRMLRKFADVAGPAVAEEASIRSWGDGEVAGAAFALLELGEEVGDEFGQVLEVLAEGRDGDGEDVDAVVEVFAEAALGDHGLEVAVRGGDEADVGADELVAADAVEGLAFEDAEELGLEVEGEFADFVEEEGAVVGHFEFADALADGAGEGAFLVAEEFGFDEVGGHAGGVHFDEGAEAALGRGGAMARAQSSLPVPLSPRMRTVALVAA